MSTTAPKPKDREFRALPSKGVNPCTHDRLDLEEQGRLTEIKCRACRKRWALV